MKLISFIQYQINLKINNMNKQELIKEIEFIIDGMSLGENTFNIINNIKKLIENESKQSI